MKKDQKKIGKRILAVIFDNSSSEHESTKTKTEEARVDD